MLVNQSRRVQAAIALLMIVVFVLVYLSVLSTFRRDSQLNTDDSLFKLGDPANASVSLSCRLVSVDPNERQMIVRLELTPAGTYAAADGTLKEPLLVEADSVVASQPSRSRQARPPARSSSPPAWWGRPAATPTTINKGRSE